MLMGTVCIFSSRFCAVTIISAISSSADAAAPLSTLPNPIIEIITIVLVLIANAPLLSI